jgi:glycosyltransferase involved in cell wall biosynthesis
MSRICLYYRAPPERDRWLPGDRFIRSWLRRIVRGEARPSGLDKVFANLCRGLDRLGISYQINLPFEQLNQTDRVGVVGCGRYALQGYDQPNPIVAGVALMTHPSEWPSLCDDYPVVTYLQHSDWANNLYRSFFGNRCRVWPVGIDTHSWHPADSASKQLDFLIYDKIRWQRETLVPGLLDPVRSELQRRQLSFVTMRYGYYDERQYRAALRRCRSMIFLCEHESQGIAYQECLSSGVPVLAWDQGWCLDPNRFKWGQPDIPATSVPYFDGRCGLRFRDVDEFGDALKRFLDLERSGAFAPREYITETLTLEKCSAHYRDLLNEAQRVPTSTADSNGSTISFPGIGLAEPRAGSA